MATVDDGSGPMDVRFDVDVSFNLTGIVNGAALTVTGVLGPNGDGTWSIRPRRISDVVIN